MAGIGGIAVFAVVEAPRPSHLAARCPRDLVIGSYGLRQTISEARSLPSAWVMSQGRFHNASIAPDFGLADPLIPVLVCAFPGIS